MRDHALTSLLQGTLEDHIHRQHISGAVVSAICQHRGPVVLAAGFEDLDGTRPMRVESRFPIWSISKTFIAVVVLRLAQRKVLTLEDRLNRWLPEIELARSATIRQLLNHTSGLPDYGVLPLYGQAIRDRNDPWNYQQFIEYTCTNDAVADPGQGWRYSNIGYMVLRRIVEVATGQPLASVIHSEITGSLHLAETAVVQRSEEFKSLTPGYSRFLDPSGAATDVREWYDPGWVAHGFLASPAADVSRFLHSLFAGELLDANNLTEMVQLIPVPGQSSANKIGYGLGIAGETDPTFGPHFGHEGGGPGYAVVVTHVPVLCDRKTTISVFCNSDECHPREISQALLHVMFRYFNEQPTVRTSQQGRLSAAQ
jgi:D-alanyl-D-alanine carboxypeptidase